MRKSDIARDVGRSMQRSLQKHSKARREKLAGYRDPAPRERHPRNDLVPKINLVYRTPPDLIAPTRNVRKLHEAHIEEIKAAIVVSGFCVPPLIDKNNNIVDGVARVEAAKALGLSSIPCIQVDHLTASEQRLVRIAVNRIGEKGMWDFGELRLELKELILDNSPIEITGFSIAEIDQIVAGDGEELPEPCPLEPDPTQSPVARVGDMFILGEHRVICGNSTNPEVLKVLMEGKSSQLILTDEPYNVPVSGHVTRGKHREFAMASGEMSTEEFLGFNEQWIAASLPYLIDGGLLGTFIDWRGYSAVDVTAKRLGLQAINLVVWAKTNAGMGSLYRSQHELLPLYKKGKGRHRNNVELGKNGRWRSNVWRYPGASSIGSDARQGLTQHPTVKPLAMLEDALLDITQRGDIVLDPFLGSGSTLMASEKCGRVCRGVELDPLYVDVILRRYERATGKEAILHGSNETVSAVARRRSLEAAD